MSEAQLPDGVRVQDLPESIRKLVEDGMRKNLHTQTFEEFGEAKVFLKVGQSGRVIVVTAQKQDIDGTWLQGQRPSLQIRPAVIDELYHYMGSFGEYLHQYLEEQRADGRIDDSRGE